MTNRIDLFVVLFVFLAATTFTGCSSKQKTAGQGMISVVAQNVVRIAGVKAMKNANLSSVKGKKIYVRTTGFADDFNKGFIENLVRTKVEDSGALLVKESSADLVVEAAVNSAGNDQGITKIPLISSAARTESTVDLTLTIRDNNTGERISKQTIIGTQNMSRANLWVLQEADSIMLRKIKNLRE